MRTCDSDTVRMNALQTMYPLTRVWGVSVHKGEDTPTWKHGDVRSPRFWASVTLCQNTKLLVVDYQRLPRRKHGACGTGNQSRIRAALNLASQTQREIQRKSKSFSTVQSRIRTAANQSQIRERERRDRQRERERERERESCTGSTQNLLNASSSLSLFL
jgi:hypothetical protein